MSVQVIVIGATFQLEPSHMLVEGLVGFPFVSQVKPDPAFVIAMKLQINISEIFLRLVMS